VGTDRKKPSPSQRRVSLPAAILLGLLVALLVWLPLPLNCGCALGPHSPSLSTLKDLRNGEKPGAHVAHAFGEIDGVFYTDSRDAFLLNYERGFRTFEVDLVLLQDGSAFCAHDGTEWMYGLDKPFTETAVAELAGRLCLGKYTPLTGSGLLDLINEYTDACFLLDTKRTAQNSNHAILEALVSEARERHLSVLDRMIPHTFGPADLWEVAKIHHFSDYWVAVYSFRCNINRSSSTDADRVVLYAIANGGLAGLQGTEDIKKISASPYGTLLGALSLLRCPSLGLILPLCGTRLYVSVDIIDSDAAPSPS
jgi:glycerophosphoryl diester phosphodiesterase